MVIIITLVLLFILFFFIRKNIGPALLATIAGVSIYQMSSGAIVDFLAKIFSGAPTELLQVSTYLVLVLGLPLLLYFRCSKGGLFGILRILEAVIFAALLTSLCSSQIAYFFSFDGTAQEIVSFIDSIKAWVMAGGVIAAYLDIMLSRQV